MPKICYATRCANVNELTNFIIGFCICLHRDSCHRIQRLCDENVYFILFGKGVESTVFFSAGAVECYA